jgi:outer membrane immunogenic protein
MKKLAIALTAIAAFAGPALAADMAPRYSKAPPPPPLPVATWTGCYIAGGGGYGLWNQENTGFIDPPLVATRTLATATSTAGGRGYFGTVQGGCDYQFSLASWQVVVGGFADYDFASIKGQLNLPTSGLFGTEKMTDKWAVGGRIGVLITPQLLTYFSAGYTEAKFGQTNFDFIGGVPPAVVPGFGAYWQSRWYKGWFLGAGDEYALSFLPGLFWKTEYRFSEYDRATNPNFFAANSILGPPNTRTGFSYDSKKWDQTVRTELVYRFNWGGPLVAKY